MTTTSKTTYQIVKIRDEYFVQVNFNDGCTSSDYWGGFATERGAEKRLERHNAIDWSIKHTL